MTDHFSVSLNKVLGPVWASLDLDEVVLDADTRSGDIWVDQHFKTDGIPTPPEDGLLPVMEGNKFVGWANADWLPITRRDLASINWIEAADQLADSR